MDTSAISKALSHEILDCIPVGIIGLQNKTIVWVNSTVEHLTGLSPADMINTSVDTIERDDLKVLFSEDRNIVIRDGQNNERLLMKSILSPANNDSNIDTLLYLQDLTESLYINQEKGVLHEDIIDLSLKHPVTGLLTHRAMMLVLEPQVSRSRRYNNPLSVAILSIDYDNAEMSADHQRRAGRMLKDLLRWADLIGHDTKGNFLLVLPETSGKDAAMLAEKVTSQISDIPGISNATVGLSEWEKGDSAISLINRASCSLATS